MSTKTITQADDECASRPGARMDPFLYFALDCEHVLTSSCRYALASVDEVIIGRAEQRSARRIDEPGVRRLSLGIPDRWLSSSHARLSRVLGRWMLEDEKSKNGTFVNGAAITRAEIVDGDLIETGHVFFVFRNGERTTTDAATDLDRASLPATPQGLGTLVPQFAVHLAQLDLIARSQVCVIVQGESGTGKELAAHGVHQLSGRSGPFVSVNCGALPPSLVESALFGHRQGAFSGATEDRPGLVRAAHGGTLFLDEIGDLPSSAQTAFLRTLQDGEVLPIGATQPVRVDFRLVSATHRNLDALVAAGRFRADLLARISGFKLALPRLRDRREEIGMIASNLLTHILPERAAAVRLTLRAGRALMAYNWPLNVRELEKCLGAAVVLAGDGPIELGHLPESVRGVLDVYDASAIAADLPAQDREKGEGRLRKLSAAELRHREEIVDLLREHTGNISSVARASGKARVQIQRWIKRYGLDPASYRS